MRYQRVIAEAIRTPWAILPEKLRAIEAMLADKARGVVYSDEEIQAKISDRKAERIAQSHGAVAVLPIVGTIVQRADYFTKISGGVSTERVSRQLRELVADDSVKAIILEIDSPGGSVSGVEELAREIFEAKSKKPIVAVANSMAASAAYWLASQADEVVVTPTGQVGSIGVYAMHIDYSVALEKGGVSVSLIHAGKYKVEGNPYRPLDEEARGELQRSVDEYYEMFVAAVRRGRGDISSDVMQGRMYSAERARRYKLADRVATLDETIARFTGQVQPARGKRALTSAEIEAMRLQVL